MAATRRCVDILHDVVDGTGSGTGRLFVWLQPWTCSAVHIPSGHESAWQEKAYSVSTKLCFDTASCPQQPSTLLSSYIPILSTYLPTLITYLPTLSTCLPTACSQRRTPQLTQSQACLLSGQYTTASSYSTTASGTHAHSHNTGTPGLNPGAKRHGRGGAEGVRMAMGKRAGNWGKKWGNICVLGWHLLEDDRSVALCRNSTGALRPSCIRGDSLWNRFVFPHTTCLPRVPL